MTEGTKKPEAKHPVTFDAVEAVEKEISDVNCRLFGTYYQAAHGTDDKALAEVTGAMLNLSSAHGGFHVRGQYREEKNALDPVIAASRQISENAVASFLWTLASNYSNSSHPKITTSKDADGAVKEGEFNYSAGHGRMPHKSNVEHLLDQLKIAGINGTYEIQPAPSEMITLRFSDEDMTKLSALAGVDVEKARAMQTAVQDAFDTRVANDPELAQRYEGAKRFAKEARVADTFWREDIQAAKSQPSVVAK